jgi:hypothetical protein
MKLTKAKAKKIAVEVWSYLAEHGEIRIKIDLPEKLYNKIKFLLMQCPCCELYYVGGICPRCPLKDCSFKSAYSEWCGAKTKKTRAKYAAIIRDKLIAW